MKKALIICVCLLVLLSLFSCSAYEKHGLSQYKVGDSGLELTLYFFPNESDDFLNMFDYTNGDYHYYESSYLSVDPVAKAFAVLEYDQDVYLEAKQYCIDNMYLSSENIREYNGYVFVENLALAKGHGFLKDGRNTKFPSWFTMMGYNDSLCKLVFIGFCCSGVDDPQAAYAETDFGKFLDIFFSEYYDFNAK